MRRQAKGDDAKFWRILLFGSVPGSIPSVDDQGIQWQAKQRDARCEQ